MAELIEDEPTRLTLKQIGEVNAQGYFPHRPEARASHAAASAMQGLGTSFTP